MSDLVGLLALITILYQFVHTYHYYRLHSFTFQLTQEKILNIMNRLLLCLVFYRKYQVTTRLLLVFLSKEYYKHVYRVRSTYIHRVEQFKYNDELVDDIKERLQYYYLSGQRTMDDQFYHYIDVSTNTKISLVMLRIRKVLILHQHQYQLLAFFVLY